MKQKSQIMPSMLLICLALSLMLNAYFFLQFWQQNIVTSVPDGDSLQLASGQRIRLLGIDAPERGQCMADEARKTLELAAKGQHVRLKNTVTDDYGRTLANVFVGNQHINRMMVAGGFAKYTSVKSSYSEALKIAQNTSKQHKIGIWSETCRKTSNPDCEIKGNLRAGKKTFLLSECKNYDQTIIDTSFGDQWFCTEAEAVKAGFSKASGCINK